MDLSLLFSPISEQLRTERSVSFITTPGGTPLPTKKTVVPPSPRSHDPTKGRLELAERGVAIGGSACNVYKAQKEKRYSYIRREPPREACVLSIHAGAGVVR